MAKSAKSSLNDQQLRAVTHQGAPLLIVAGAGTGKTTVVTERIKWIIGEGLARPEEILALTFTEKAAREMETRVDEAMPYGTFGMWINTFHSFADRILRENALSIGLDPSYKLLSEAESYLLVKQNFWKFELSYYRPSGNPYKFIEGLISHFMRLKDEDVGVEEYLNFARKKVKEAEKTGDEESLEEGKRNLELAGAYRTYEELKIAGSVMDFANLIGNTLRLFRERPAVLGKYKKQFKYVLIDEFQDTNYAQYQMIKLLAPAADNPNLVVVGDDSQSIYKFRGAAISNILSFMKDYPGAAQIVLTHNYRSTQTILNSAYQLIKFNDPDTLESRLGIDKNLKAVARGSGEDVGLIYVDRGENEAEQVVNTIRELYKLGKYEYRDFAILVRANNHSEPFIRALERSAMPFQFLGPGMLFHQSEVRDLIAYLKILSDFSDSVSLYRVLSMEIWNLSQRDLIAVFSQAKKANRSLFEMLEHLDQVTGIAEETRQTLGKFTEMVHKHQSLLPKETAGQILYFFLEDSGLLKKVVEYKTAPDERRAMNITKFFDKMKSFESTRKDASVFAAVDYLDLAMSMGESPLAAEVDWTLADAVNILTVHSAKGLEFPVVFLANLIEGRFPPRERREQIPVPDELIREVLPVGDYHLEEERRLFYVGMTRAKERLFFTAANFYNEGKRERKLSPFVREALGPEKKFLPEIIGPGNQLPLFEWARPIAEKVEIKSSGIKVDYLSYSAIEAFKTCPLHYKLRYILRIPTPPSPAQSMGNSVHLALRDFYSEIMTGKITKKGGGEARLLELLRQNWIIEGYGSKKHEADSLAKAENFLRGYLKSDLHKTARPLSLEQPFTIKLDPTLKLGGKIDRVDDLGNGKVEIVDYKTGANVPTQKEIDIDMQMNIYALAAIDKSVLAKPVDQVRFSFYFFDSQSKLTTVRSMDQLDKAREEILKAREEIEKSDFVCSDGIICKNCEYRMLCNG